MEHRVPPDPIGPIAEAVRRTAHQQQSRRLDGTARDDHEARSLLSALGVRGVRDVEILHSAGVPGAGLVHDFVSLGQVMISTFCRFWSSRRVDTRAPDFGPSRPQLSNLRATRSNYQASTRNVRV
jgi:hypothetical protein